MWHVLLKGYNMAFQISRILSRKELYISISIMLVLVFGSLFLNGFYLYGRYENELVGANLLILISKNEDFIFQNAYTFFLLPFLSTMVASDIYLEEKESGIAVQILSKMTWRKYILVTAVCVFCVSFLTIALPIVISQVLSLFMAPLAGEAFFDYLPAYSSDHTRWAYLTSLFENHPYGYNCYLILLNGLVAGMVGVFGFLLSFFSKKRISVSIIPTMIYLTVLVILSVFGKSAYILGDYLRVISKSSRDIRDLLLLLVGMLCINILLLAQLLIWPKEVK